LENFSFPKQSEEEKMKLQLSAINESKKLFAISVAFLILGGALWLFPAAPIYAAPKATITVTNLTKLAPADNARCAMQLQPRTPILQDLDVPPVRVLTQLGLAR